MAVDTSHVALGGGLPGEPISIDIMVPPGQFLPLPPIKVQFVKCDPGRFYNVLVNADVNKDGNTVPIFYRTAG